MESYDEFKKNSGNMKSSKERKIQTEKKLSSMGIAYNEWLPMVEDANDVHLKSFDDICKRAIACLLSTQIACDIENGEVEKSQELFSGLMEKYGVRDCLNEKEQKLLGKEFITQDAINVAWTYEAYWAIVWALGLIEDISDSSEICDCERAIQLVSSNKSYEEFRDKCHLRDIEEILDMLDLYYRYHWACTEKRINPETPISNLNPEVVVERRRGLEWLISDQDDWFDISLDT